MRKGIEWATLGKVLWKIEEKMGNGTDAQTPKDEIIILH